MPTFRVLVGTSGGERMTIEHEAASEQALLEDMAAQGLFVIECTRQAGEGLALGELFGPAYSSEDLLELTTSLRSLVTAGIPLYQALKIINQDEESAFKRRLMANVIHDLSFGLSLSDALSKRPDEFPLYYVRTIAAAESTGRLSEALDELASVIRRTARIRGRAASAVFYPAVLLCLMLIIVVIMLGFVFPTLETFFAGYGVELPADTRMLLALSRWVKANLLKCAVFAFGGSYFLWKLFTSPSLKPWFDRTRYDLPVLGRIFLYADLSLLGRTVAMLLKAGTPVNEALASAELTMENSEMSSRVRETRLRVEKGEALSSAAGRSGLLEPKACRVLRVGEESGSLSASFGQLALFCEERLETATERFIAMLEPAMVILAGLMILALLATMIRPMLESLGKI